jgi:hypothetical protein
LLTLIFESEFVFEDPTTIYLLELVLFEVPDSSSFIFIADFSCIADVVVLSPVTKADSEAKELL